MRVLVGLAAVVALGAAPSAAPVTVAVSSAVSQAMIGAGIPGAEVTVVSQGHVIIDSGYGVRDLTTSTPVDAQTRFEIGSVTKQFTAAAILQLKERGKLSLDDRLGAYIPAYVAARNVTIQQLLWQTSGIPNYTDTNGFVQFSTTHAGSVDAILALVKDKPLEFTPGTKWRYSNTNYALLGRIVEIASHMPWDAYVREHIFAPAGMTHSTFNEDEASVTDMATGYAMFGGKLVPAPAMGHWALGAGSIVSTTGDLARWDDAFFGGRIVSAADVTLATTPGRLSNGTSTGYGFGWVIDRHDAQQRIDHNGGTFGYTAINEVFPALHERITVLVNDSAAQAETIASAVFAALHPDLAASENVSAAGEDLAVTARVEDQWRRVVAGNPDRTQLTAEFNRELTPQLLSTAQASFSALGPPTQWVYKGKTVDGSGTTTYAYRALFRGGVVLAVYMSVTKDGKIAGFLARSG